MEVLIKRSNTSTTNGKRGPLAVYVTGPHFGGDIYSSTIRVEDASRFAKEEVKKLLATGHWRGHNIWIVPVDEADDLPI